MKKFENVVATFCDSFKTLFLIRKTLIKKKISMINLTETPLSMTIISIKTHSIATIVITLLSILKVSTMTHSKLHKKETYHCDSKFNITQHCTNEQILRKRPLALSGGGGEGCLLNIIDRLCLPFSSLSASGAYAIILFTVIFFAIS